MLTVLIATHNGQQTLPQVLASYQRIAVPLGGWRLVVVDNASSDDTPAILQSFSAQLPLTMIRTQRQGKNLALNLALDQIRCETYVLTDDDIVPAEDWLLNVTQAMAEHPQFDLFGGAIVPRWPKALPDWIERLVPLGATFGLTEACKPSGEVPPHDVWGGNMAVRGTLFDSGYRFAEDVGPAAGQYAMGSEVEFSSRIAREGHRSWFMADAVVEHIVRPHQLSEAWIIQRAYRLGRHMYHQDRLALAGNTHWCGMPRWKLRQLLSWQARGWRARLVGDKGRRFQCAWEVSLLRGYLAEARHLAKGPAE